jgi:hypothetical protein
MTRNLFLGADLIPLATTARGAPFQQAAGALYDGVRATDPDASGSSGRSTSRGPSDHGGVISTLRLKR